MAKDLVDSLEGSMPRMVSSVPGRVPEPMGTGL